MTLTFIFLSSISAILICPVWNWQYARYNISLFVAMDQNLIDEDFSESCVNENISFRNTNKKGEKSNKCNQCEYAPSVKSSLRVLGILGPGQLGPGQLGPGQLGPGAQLSISWGRTVQPRGPTVRGPVVRGPKCLEPVLSISIKYFIKEKVSFNNMKKQERETSIQNFKT